MSLSRYFTHTVGVPLWSAVRFCKPSLMLAECIGILLAVTLPCVTPHAVAQTLDQYGGYTALPSPNGATGYFRVEKMGNRWVFVTPAGNAFWMRSVYAVHWMDGGDTYHQVVTTKYADGQFYPQAVRRLRAWGFNALGEYSDLYALPVGTYGRSTGNPEKLPFLITMNATIYGIRSGTFKNLFYGVDTAQNPGVYVGIFPDVFDPAFSPFVEKFARDDEGVYNGAATLNASPWLVGVTTDDGDYTTGFGPGPDAAVSQGKTHPHLGWIVAVTAPTKTSATIWGVPVTYADSTVYSKLAWRDYLRTKYGTLAALNAAWGATYTSWDSDGGWPSGRGVLDESGRNPWIGGDFDVMTRSAAVTTDLDTFLETLADRYFSVYASKLRTYLPNHLVFGPATMQAGTRVPILRAAGRNLDVIQTSGVPLGPSYPFFQRIYDVAAKPAFVWTTFMAQGDANLTSPDLFGWGPSYNSATQDQRGLAYGEEIQNLLSLRGANGDAFVMGIDWWEWVDKVTGGENMNFGLVTVRDNAYDGKEARIATSTDPWGYPTGGEPKDYGNFLLGVTTAHGLILNALTGGTGNPPPTALTVSVTSPTSGTTLDGTVSVAAAASTAATRVDLLLDGAVVGTYSGTAASYSWDTKKAGNGTHRWAAKAYASSGTAADSAPVDVVVNNADTTPPVVTLSVPSPIARRSRVTLSATASDDVGVVKVEFYMNGVLLCADTAGPYTCDWKVPGAANRSYVLQAKAYDAAGNAGASAPVTVTAK